MPTADPNVLTVACPGCGAQFRFLIETAGHKGQCAKCGVKFMVPQPPAAPATPAPSPSASVNSPVPQTAQEPELEPEYIGFECRLCQTRMYGRLDQVGKKFKCPDCGVLTAVPPPAPPKKKNIPAALEGEQYELWSAADAPLPSELIAQQPRYIAVSCRKCATLFYATEAQAGQSIACPDCGTKHAVAAPPKLKPRASVLARDVDTPKLDAAAHPGDRPAVEVPSKHKMVYEERQEAEYARAVEKSKRTGKPMEIDSRGRPVIPRWPLISGVLPFLFSKGVPVRWFAFSAGFIGSLSLLASGLETAMSGGLGAIAGMCFFAIGSILTTLCAAAAASALMAIITESSEGNREIQYWPGIHDWLGDLLVLVVAGMVSAVPGALFGKIPGMTLAGDAQAVLAAGGTLFFLPIVLMSQLDIDSPWGVLSTRVLSSFAKCPFSWLLFYLEIGLIAAACGAVTFYAAGQNPGAAIWLTPMYFAAALLFARLLGRLGWRLGDAMPARA